MTLYTAVLPSIHKPFTDACLDSMCSDLRRHTVVWDNTVENDGVPASWNVGAGYARIQEAQWLVILSASVRFGPAGGLDFLDALADCERRGPLPVAIEADDGMGWHLIAFNMEAWDAVGGADERFFPAYDEDTDLAYRMWCEFGEADGWDTGGPWWPKVHVDATLAEVAHGIKRGGVKVDMGAQRQKFVDKHGGPPGEEAFRDSYGSCLVCRSVWEECCGTHGSDDGLA